MSMSGQSMPRALRHDLSLEGGASAGLKEASQLRLASGGFCRTVVFGPRCPDFHGKLMSDPSV
jgi:hypothetical protein